MQESDEERKPDVVIGSDTPNATQVPVREAPPDKKEKFKRLAAHNKDTWNGSERENKEVTHRQDNLHRYDAISSSLELTPYQQERGRQLLDEIDLEPYSLDLVVFSLCVLLVNRDVRRGNRYYPNESGGDDRLFEDMADSLGLPEKRQASMVETLRQKVEL